MSVVSGIVGYFGTKEASEEAATAQKEGMQTEWNMFNQTREDQAPWREAGKTALNTLMEQIKAGPGKFEPTKEPGYEFGYKNFVEKPYLSGQSAKGKRLSGETIKGLTKYASDYAETAYDNFLARYYQKLNPNLSMAGLGQTATGQTASAAQQFGNAIASLQGNIGNARGQAAMAGGQLFGNISQGAQSGYNNYMNYKMMNKIMGTGGNTYQAPTSSYTVDDVSSYFSP